jgi:hypothetical protein
MQPATTPDYRPATSSVSGVAPDRAAGYFFVGPTATPFSSGPGAVPICAPDAAQTITFVLGVDTPRPRCAVVRADQWLRVVNEFHEKVIATLGRLRIVVGDRGSVTVRVPFSAYLTRGTWLLTPNFYQGAYNAEIRY